MPERPVVPPVPPEEDPTVGTSPYGEYPGPDAYRFRVAALARERHRADLRRRRIRFWGGLAGLLELVGLTTFGVVVLRQGRVVGLVAVGMGLWLGFLGLESLTEAWRERRRRW